MNGSNPKPRRLLMRARKRHGSQTYPRDNHRGTERATASTAGPGVLDEAFLPEPNGLPAHRACHGICRNFGLGGRVWRRTTWRFDDKESEKKKRPSTLLPFMDGRARLGFAWEGAFTTRQTISSSWHDGRAVIQGGAGPMFCDLRADEVPPNYRGTLTEAG